METLLRAAWHDCLPGLPRAEAILDGLVARYREPHRRYHGVAHLSHVIRDVGVLCPSVELAVSPAVIRLAAFFHDAIYDPQAHDNEAASAALARRALGDIGVTETSLVEIDRLIMTTVDHAADDPAAAVLADADLAVLGAEPTAYAAYVAGVRSEYRHVDDAAWNVGRPIVLRRFLDRPTIYRTPPMLTREARARANLTAELHSLEQR